MKICPSCRVEFLDQIIDCSDCQVNLIDESLAHTLAAPKEEFSAEEFLAQNPVAFIEGQLSHCRELEKILRAKKIHCLVMPVSLEAGGNAATLGSSCSMKYMLLVSEKDVESCKAALEDTFDMHVAKEGMGERVKTAVDVSKDEVCCPACGETGALKEGECASCGLYLAVE